MSKSMKLPLTVDRSSVTGTIMNVRDANGRTPIFVGLTLAGGVPGSEAYENTDLLVNALNAHHLMQDALFLVRSSAGWPYLSAETKAVIDAALAAAEPPTPIRTGYPACESFVA